MTEGSRRSRPKLKTAVESSFVVSASIWLGKSAWWYGSKLSGGKCRKLGLRSLESDQEEAVSSSHSREGDDQGEPTCWGSWEIDPGDVEILKDKEGQPVLLGQGGFGSVYRGTWKGCSTVAVKVVGGVVEGYGQGTSQDRAARAFLQEGALMSSLRDRHLVQFLGASLEEGRAMLLMEFCERGDLCKALQCDSEKSRRLFSWYTWEGPKKIGGLGFRIALDIARGLAFLHARNVVHFDLKTSNVLLNREYAAKIADVGLARILQKEQFSNVSTIGTFAYTAPEVLLGRECCEKADIYSLGVVFWEMSCMEPPSRRLRDPVPAECPKEIKELIDKCLAEKPRDRPSALKVVQILQSIAKNQRQN